MWDSALLLAEQRVTDALLRKPVLPDGGEAFEKVSAAIAVRTALRARVAEQTLFFLVPEVTANTARRITAALLVGNHAHANGGGMLPPVEVMPLFKRDVLLVTQAVSECKAKLDELPIGSYQRLRDLWDVVPLSKYTKSKIGKPRVYLANPGWFLADKSGRRFGAVVIDASHPRTYDRIRDLVEVAEGCSALRIAVSPPIADAPLRACGYPDRAAVWGWDPAAMEDAQSIVGSTDGVRRCLGERFLWVCDSDTEAAEVLGALHRQLAAATRIAAGKPYPGLQLCWSIHNRLRQLTVPLAQLEQVSSRTWAGSLRERVDLLRGVDGQGNVAWDTTWSALSDAVMCAYQTLLKREETAKFWALASSLETFVGIREGRVRIVAATQAEGDLLLQMLSQVVDGVDEATADGRLEIVTSAGEARLVAEGQLSRTFLLGPRPSPQRYLDVFASQRIDEFLYPYEIAIERAAQARLYGIWTQIAADGTRMQLLAPLGLGAADKTTGARPVSPMPHINIAKANGHAVSIANDAEVSSGLDIDSFTDGLSFGGVDENSALHCGDSSATAGSSVEVKFTRGTEVRYYADQTVDVFFSESGATQRHPASSLQPGWQVISFVDGRYDGLFKRMTEVVNARLPPRERIAIDLWHAAKQNILAQHKHKRLLHEKLRISGLKSSYETFATWFGGEEGVLAPQQLDDFAVLAQEWVAYRSPVLLRATFDAVQHARGRNRSSGRLLRSFLRAVVSGDGYDEALESARKLDTALGDVLAAVEILEVHSVRVIDRS